MKTLTLPESEIITLADAAKKHGTVELAKTIGIGKSQLYRILCGHNRMTPETADKISAWLSTGIPEPEERLASPTLPDTIWDDPQFIRLAVMQVAEAVLQGRLKNISSTINGGHCKCGD